MSGVGASQTILALQVGLGDLKIMQGHVGTFVAEEFASSGEFVGDGERQRAVLARNRWNLRHVESNDLC